jgi:putative DNA methylase
LIEQAERVRHELDFGLPKYFEIKHGPKSEDLIRRGITSYLDLFSSRQLIYLGFATDLLKEYDPIIRLNLALLVSTSLEFNSMLCGYKGADVRRPGAIRHTFSHHAYSFPYTALENNPVYASKTSGTLAGLFNSRIRRARKWAQKPIERCIVDKSTNNVVMYDEVDAGKEALSFAGLIEGKRRFLLIQGNSSSLGLEPDSVDYIVTDPPYFDSVQYSDLAIFFNVWLRRFLPDYARWDYDLNESAVDPQTNGKGQYTEVMSAIFKECHRVLRKESGRMVFTFHHWNPKGWAALTIALKRAGFVLENRYVVHSENPVSVHITNLKALTHDAILVLASADSCVPSKWDRPDKINKADSKSFCQDCATLLGWMLSADVKDEAIMQKWQSILK